MLYTIDSDDLFDNKTATSGHFQCLHLCLHAQSSLQRNWLWLFGICLLSEKIKFGNLQLALWCNM